MIGKATARLSLHILGSLSGTEPMPGRKHSSFLLELPGGGLYCFDAGEGCSRTAHLMGADLLRLKAIFISHPHIDHVGGLANLLWTLRKLSEAQSRTLQGPIPVFHPSPGQFEAVTALLAAAGQSFGLAVQGSVGEGRIYDDGALSVDARANAHIPAAGGEPPLSYSYRIAAGDRRIVFSGDIHSVEELGDWLLGCDMLLMESGHHSPPDVCRRLIDMGATIGTLVWTHHGLDILRDPAGIEKQCAAVWRGAMIFASDRMTLSLGGNAE